MLARHDQHAFDSQQLYELVARRAPADGGVANEPSPAEGAEEDDEEEVALSDVDEPDEAPAGGGVRDRGDCMEVR